MSRPIWSRRCSFVASALMSLVGACSDDTATGGNAGAGGAGAATMMSAGGTAGSDLPLAGAAGPASGGMAGQSEAGSQATAGSGGQAEAGSPAAGTGGESGAGDAGATGGDGGAAGAPITGMPQQESVASLMSARSEHGVGAVGGRIYVVGGLGANGNRVAAYDPATDRWTQRANLPMSMEHPNVAVASGKLYVVGGGLFSTTGRTFEYDPEADRWTERASMPAGTQRASACVVGFETKVYVFGGARVGAGTVVQASAFDTVANSWEALPDVPQPPRQHCGAGEIDGILYIVAGRSAFPSPFTPRPLAFDPVAKTYTEGAPMPTPRGGVAAAVLGGRIYVFGGEGNSAAASGVFREVEAYDPRADRWEQLPDMLVPRHGFGAATIGQRIYLPGGAEAQAGSNISAAHTVFFYE
jgi:N-acetylneuraminic acid mutarotase